MNRRELLAAVGVGATGMVGLLGNGATGAEQDATTTETTNQTTTAGEGFTGIDSSAERPFATISVGSREAVQNPENNQPHVVRVWNDSDEARTIGLRLVRGAGRESALVDRQVEFPADGYLTLRLLEPANYALTIQPGGDGTTATSTATATASAGETIEIPRSQFDCNDSTTEVAVTADAQVKHTTVTTEIGCPPEVTDRTFTSLAGSCGSASEASVSFAEDSVEVSGSVRAPNPCYGAQLADVSVSSDDTLRVTVTTTEPTAGVCAQCVASIEYEADLTFRDRVPETVEVVHRTMGGTETVATVTRGATTTVPGTTTASETTASGTTIDR